MKSTEDYTIFAWSVTPSEPWTLDTLEGVIRDNNLSPLADDPAKFRLVSETQWRYSSLVPIPRHAVQTQDSSSLSKLAGLGSDDSPPTLTGRGLRICLPLVEYGGIYLACIYLRLSDTQKLVCLRLRKVQEDVDLFRRDSSGQHGFEFVSPIRLPEFKRVRIFI